MCALLTAYWSFFVGAALMAMAYPLFILTACDSEPRKAYQRGAPPGFMCLRCDD